MRKIVLLVVALILSTTLSSAAFASQSEDRAHYSSDSKISSSNYGDHSYGWYHTKAVLHVKKYSDFYKKRIAELEKILNNYNKGYSHSHWNYDRDIERYFYVDANGVNHYFYLDPDKDYTVHQYKDDNGITQYWFEDAGWK